jgi:enoyl-CoA hydratase/carnithine racemase
MMPFVMRMPVIAAVQGHVLGAGCELAMFCDLVIAADNAKFGEPEIRFGTSGPGFILPWIIGYRRAREMLLFGDLIGAETALEYGMINRIVPLADLDQAALNYAHRLSRVGPEALAATKLALNRGAEAAGLRNAIQSGLDVIAPLYAADTEVANQFREKRAEMGLAAALKWRRTQFDE